MAMDSAKEVREYLADVINWHGRKAQEAAKSAEAKLAALVERDKARDERKSAQERALKDKYPAIKKGR